MSSNEHLDAIREICGVTEDAPYGWDVYGDDIKDVVAHAETMAKQIDQLQDLLRVTADVYQKAMRQMIEYAINLEQVLLLLEENDDPQFGRDFVSALRMAGNVIDIMKDPNDLWAASQEFREALEEVKVKMREASHD